MKIKKSELYADAILSIAADMEMEHDLKIELLTLLGCDRRDAQYLEETESAGIQEATRHD